MPCGGLLQGLQLPWMVKKVQSKVPLIYSARRMELQAIQLMGADAKKWKATLINNEFYGFSD